ncbi:MFS transporter [Paenibacillus hunanensis]|uniref:MFS transporter n=1 Tax=Paenibacillus hunanensis TaxID=539262 RepID=UPI001668CCE6|nr:MFS transporter [Paenibacillus hunanensis]GGJ08984.1 putative glycolipid permease LtaA [Paenibacillus hunanensis]
MSSIRYEATSKTARNNRILFIYLWLLIFFVEFVKGGLLVTLLPLYMGHRLGLPAFAIGVAFASQYIGDNALRSPAGWMAERLGFRLTMTLGMLLILAAVIVMSTVQHPGWLIVACATMGIGSAPLWPCVMSKITDISSETGNYGTHMGIIEIASLGGAGLGPVVMNWLSGDSYTFSFGMLLLCMIVVVVVALFLPGRTKQRPSTSSQVANIEADQTAEDASIDPAYVRQPGESRLHYYVQLMRSLHIHPLLYPALFMQSFALGVLTPIITLYVVSELGLTPAYFNALLIGGGAVTVLGLIPAGRLIDRVGSKLFLRTGFLLAATALLGLASTRALPWIWVFVLCAGFSYAMILPAWNSLLANLVPAKEKGAVWGLFLTLQGSGLVLGPIVSGKLWDDISPQAPFYVSAAAMLLLFIIHWVMIRQRPNIR